MEMSSDLGTFQFKRQFDLLSTNTPEYEFTVPYIVENAVARLPHRRHFVDVGAGRGNLMKPLSKHFAVSSAVEPNELYHRELVEWARASGTKVSAYNQSWLDVELDDCADLFLMSHVLYYVPREEWLAFIDKAHGLLRPGGRIVIILNSLTNDVTKLYREFLKPDEWREIASAEAIGEMLQAEGYDAEASMFTSNIYAGSREDVHQLIDFLLLGRARFDDPAAQDHRAAYADARLRMSDGEGYAIRADAGLITIARS